MVSEKKNSQLGNYSIHYTNITLLYFSSNLIFFHCLLEYLQRKKMADVHIKTVCDIGYTRVCNMTFQLIHEVALRFVHIIKVYTYSLLTVVVKQNPLHSVRVYCVCVCISALLTIVYDCVKEKKKKKE